MINSCWSFLSRVIRVEMSSFGNLPISSRRHKWGWNPYIHSREHCCLKEDILFEVPGFNYLCGLVSEIKRLGSFVFSNFSGTARFGSWDLVSGCGEELVFWFVLYSLVKFALLLVLSSPFLLQS